MKEYTEFFVPVVLGVMFGEILFQINRHYVMKWRQSFEGYITCLEHSVIFTMFMMVFLYLFNGINLLNIQVMLCILVSHYIIDKFSIPLLWMKYIKVEESPILQYYQRKISAKYDHGVNKYVFINFIKEHPVMEVDEDLLNGNSFYVSELYIINLILHVVVMFIVISICKLQGII